MAPQLTDVNRKQQKFLLSQSRSLVLLMALYFIVTSVYLVMNILAMEVHAAHGKETLVSTDSQHYLQFAHRFLKGNFSMDYIREAPHRQPLYPFALAVASKIGNGNLFFLGEVNVVAMTLVIGSVYFGVLRFFQSANIALICALCVAGNLFMWRIAGERLLTEPLYVLLMVWVIIAFLQFLREGKIYWLLLTALLLGLAYLTRPNGIFGAAACFAVLLLAETMTPSRVGEARPPFYRRLWRLIPKYVGAGLLFIVVTIPSWLPRLVYFNNPLYTGYLTNFLWVDTYHLAHDFGIRPRYTWHDYAATHNLLDAVWRLVYGFCNVCIVLPIGAEKLPILYLLSVAGVYTALKTGPREFRFLLIFFLIQLLPLIWTNMPNPNTRVPYGSTFPFAPFFAACFLALAGASTWDRLSRRVGRRPVTIAIMRSRFFSWTKTSFRASERSLPKAGNRRRGVDRLGCATSIGPGPLEKPAA